MRVAPIVAFLALLAVAALAQVCHEKNAFFVGAALLQIPPLCESHQPSYPANLV